MIRIKGVREIVKLCYFALFVYIFLATQNIISLPTVVTDILIAGFVVVSTALDGWKLKIKKDSGYYFSMRHFVLPVVLMLVYSLVNQLIRGLSSDYLVHTITLCVRFLEYYLLGIMSVRVFGERTADFLLAVALCAYVPAFIRHFSMFGVINGLLVLLTQKVFGMQIKLEVHTMTYIFGFLTLYFAYNLFVKKNEKAKVKFFVSLFLTFAGVKRIVSLSLFVSLIMMLLLNRIKPGKRYALMRMISVLMVVASFVYLSLIHSGILEKVFDTLKIGASFRFNFWNYFRDKYSVSPWFLGYGISYGARVMQHEWQNIQGLGSLTNLHNDVLRIFLGLGFWGSLAYWFNFFYASMRRIKKICSVNAATFCLAVCSYYFLTSFVSNEGINGVTNGVFFLVIYIVVQAESSATRAG